MITITEQTPIAVLSQGIMLHLAEAGVFTIPASLITAAVEVAWPAAMAVLQQPPPMPATSGQEMPAETASRADWDGAQPRKVVA